MKGRSMRAPESVDEGSKGACVASAGRASSMGLFVASKMHEHRFMTVRGLAAIAVFGTLVGSAGFVACSSKEESVFDVEPSPSSTTDAGTVDPNGSFSDEPDADAAPSSCPPSDASEFAPRWAPPTKPDASTCMDGDIAGYWNACLADPSAKEACAKWTADHASCAACIEPTNGSGPIEWHLDRYYMTLNVGGCVALQQGDASETSCGAAYNASVQCTRSYCEGCFAAGGTFEQFTACQKQVQADKTCDAYRTAQGQACSGYKDTGSPALACFMQDGETNEAFFKRVIGLFCGGS